MPKLTKEQWSKLTREEKRQAVLEFREPQNIYEKPKNYYYLTKEEKV